MELTYTKIRALDFISNYERRDIEENIRDFKEFINVIINIQNYISESQIKFPIWKLALDTFTTKFVLHCNSFITLISGTKLDIEYYKNNKKIIIDIPSCQVLLRAQLENFLMADFIYFQPTEENESMFRYYCWDYSSLKSISKYKAKSEKLKKYIFDNESELKQIWEKIENSRYFTKMTKDQRKKLKNYGDSRLSYNWDDLIKLSNLNPLLFDNFYSLLSKHAHSESFGIFHLKNSKLGYHKNHSEAFLILLLSKSLVCLYITRLKNYIKTAEIKLNTFSPKIIEDIKLYSMFIDEKILKTST